MRPTRFLLQFAAANGSGQFWPGPLPESFEFTHPADCTIQYTVDTANTSALSQIRFRMPDSSDSDNCWQLVNRTSNDTFTLQERFNASNTDRGQTSSLSDGDVITIALSGTTIAVQINGVDAFPPYTNATRYANSEDGQVGSLNGAVYTNLSISG